MKESESEQKIKDVHVWISEVLTKRLAELAYQEGWAVHDNLAVQTWTRGGNMFIKFLKENTDQEKNDMDADLHGTCH